MLNFKLIWLCTAWRIVDQIASQTQENWQQKIAKVQTSRTQHRVLDTQWECYSHQFSVLHNINRQPYLCFSSLLPQQHIYLFLYPCLVVWNVFPWCLVKPMTKKKHNQSIITALYTNTSRCSIIHPVRKKNGPLHVCLLKFCQMPTNFKNSHQQTQL